MVKQDENILLETENISKRFGAVQALLDVDFKVSKGEVHALVGENGAGKSTLINILGGVIKPDRGKIKLEGEYVSFEDPLASQKRGVSVIFQEFKLMPDLTVAENIFIGREHIKTTRLIDWKKLNQLSRELLERLESDIDPEKIVEELSVAEKQFVEIAKALSFDARIVIMDEPTATLDEDEANILFRTIKELKKKNYTIIYVSHRLEEIFEIGDRVSVLRDGNLIGTREVSETNEDELVRMMVGRNVEDIFEKDKNKKDECFLKVKNFNVLDKVNNFNLEIYKGEILGLAGIIGSGRSQVTKALAGILPFSGQIYIKGREVNIDNPKDALKVKIGHLPEDRGTEGIFPQMTVKNNLTIKALKDLVSPFFKFINSKQENELFNRFAESVNIKYSDRNDSIMSLSGGNQQKVILSRALASKCDILILEEPTQGIDVGAKAEIHKLMNELAGQGIAIIMSSSEIPEIINMTDRCVVMQRGEITGYLEGEKLNEKNIGACATGSKRINVERVGG